MLLWLTCFSGRFPSPFFPCLSLLWLGFAAFQCFDLWLLFRSFPASHCVAPCFCLPWCSLLCPIFQPLLCFDVFLLVWSFPFFSLRVTALITFHCLKGVMRICVPLLCLLNFFDLFSCFFDLFTSPCFFAFLPCLPLPSFSLLLPAFGCLCLLFPAFTLCTFCYFSGVFCFSPPSTFSFSSFHSFNFFRLLFSSLVSLACHCFDCLSFSCLVIFTTAFLPFVFPALTAFSSYMLYTVLNAFCWFAALQVSPPSFLFLPFFSLPLLSFSCFGFLSLIFRSFISSPPPFFSLPCFSALPLPLFSFPLHLSLSYPFPSSSSFS